MSLPVLSQRSVEGDVTAIERGVVANVHDISDSETLLDWLRTAEALAVYWATRKGAQGPMHGAKRRIEARVGELLGPAPGRGTRTDLDETSHHDDKLEALHRQLKDDFRLLGRAFKDVRLEDDEWRYGRRRVVRTIRTKLGLVDESAPLPEGEFATIVADPPWQLDTGSTFGGAGTEGHDPLDYFSMSVDDVAALGEELAEHLPENAHLYLWTTNRYVEAAYSIARDWGFKPSVLLVWAKAPQGVGLGDAYKLTTEFALFARRGSLANLDTTPSTWFSWARGRHSAKPAGFYEMVERMSPGPRLEMFARGPREGWTVWGAEASDAA